MDILDENLFSRIQRFFGYIMKKIDDEFDLLSGLMKCIAAQFGENCEVVLHDLSKELSHTIVAIENGHITGREIGGCATDKGFEAFRRILNSEGEPDQEDLYNYTSTTKDGKVLRSSTINIKNDVGGIIGSICINFDISDFIFAENTIKSITKKGQVKNHGEVHVKNVNEILEMALQKCQDEIGKPVALMKKEEKIKAIDLLDKKGIFLITKSGNRVCDFLNISKYTLYHILDEIRNRK